MRMKRLSPSVLWMLAACASAGPMVSGAMGQLVPPPPPRTPPTPEYTPPPPPPPPPTPAPAQTPASDGTASSPDGPLPSLVQRDESGKVKPLPIPAEEAAVRALKPNEDVMKKVEVSLGARRDDLDRMVIEQIEALAELRKFSTEVNEKTSMEEIQTKAKKVHPFRSFPGVLDRLAREGAINPQLKARASKVAEEYQKATDSDLMKGFEHSNTQAMVLVGFRRFLSATTTEAYASLDRQLAAAAPRAEALINELPAEAGSKTAATSKLRGLPSAGTEANDARRLETLKTIFFDTLNTEQQKAFLKAANPKLFEAAPASDAK